MAIFYSGSKRKNMLYRVVSKMSFCCTGGSRKCHFLYRVGSQNAIFCIGIGGSKIVILICRGVSKMPFFV